MLIIIFLECPTTAPGFHRLLNSRRERSLLPYEHQPRRNKSKGFISVTTWNRGVTQKTADEPPPRISAKKRRRRKATPKKKIIKPEVFTESTEHSSSDSWPNFNDFFGGNESLTDCTPKWDDCPDVQAPVIETATITPIVKVIIRILSFLGTSLEFL